MSADQTKGVWALISSNFQEILSETWSFILIFIYINFEFLGHTTPLVRSWPIYIKLHKNHKGVFDVTVAIGRVSYSKLSGWCLTPPPQSCA